MPTISISEAKTHFSNMLDRLQKGERFIITNRGRPVAKLLPLNQPDPNAIRRTISDIRSFREILRKRGVQVSDLLKKEESLRDLAHLGHRP